jgi:hypothetical protein
MGERTDTNLERAIWGRYHSTHNHGNRSAMGQQTEVGANEEGGCGAAAT